jgi:hypothetical protein
MSGRRIVFSTPGRLAGLSCLVVLLSGAAGFLGATLYPAPARSQTSNPAREESAKPIPTEELIRLYRTIELTPDQEAIRQRALGPLRAPCCKEFSAATCCCECNMSRAAWGLAKHLIVEKGKGAEEVRSQVEQWYKSINPAGFSGTACSTGGCAKPFAKDGCGGMNPDLLIQ